MAGVQGLNLSFKGLTSYTIRETLHQLKNTKPEFWKELDNRHEKELADHKAATLEDQQTNVQHETTVDNDSAVSILQVATNLKIVPDVGGTRGQSGGIVAIREAELLDFCGDEEIARKVEEELGCGKCKHKANVLYSHGFWLSHDE